MKIDDPERERGVLAPIDRKYLLGIKEYDSRQAAYGRRTAIRERVHNAILDFSLLLDRWGHDEMWGLRDGWKEEFEDIDDPALEQGLRDMVVFALYLARGDVLLREHREHTTAAKLLLDIFRRLGRERGLYVRNYDLDVDAEQIPVVDILDRLEDGEDVPPEHLLWALTVDQFEVDPEPIQQALQDEFRKQLLDDEDAP